MSRKIYAIYAKRRGKQFYWTEWCRVRLFSDAMRHASTIDKLGCCCRVYNVKTRELVYSAPEHLEEA